MATSLEATALGSGHSAPHAPASTEHATVPGAPNPTSLSRDPAVSNDISAAEKQHHATHWDYGGNPLAHQWSHASHVLGPDAARLQPGLFKPVDPRRANAAPLGLSGFALTTFVLSMVNLHVRNVAVPNVFVGPAIAYGGIIQLLAGMWEMAAGNTFAAWALSSYGGWWIGLGVLFIPGGFDVVGAYGGQTEQFFTALAFYIYGWFIFTVFVWLATLRATLVFNVLILTVWIAFLCLATSYYYNTGGEKPMPQYHLQTAGGAFGIIASFLAWWVMLAGCLDKETNSFFNVPTFPFPWSPEGSSRRGKTEDMEKNE